MNYPQGVRRPRKGASPLKKITLIALLAIILLALVIRVINVGHPLTWDEAWDVLTVTEKANSITNSRWTYGFYHHPPLYMGTGILIAKTLNASRFNVAIVMEILSILFALASVLLIFMCGRDWFDERTGLLAAFFYAVMPAAGVYDSWIKQDSLAVALSLAFLLLFFRKRYVIAGLFLGLALLAKENAVFVVPAVFAFLVMEKKGRELWALVYSSAIACVVSAWWYVFFSKSTGRFMEFFLGGSAEAKMWSGPWHQYLVRIPVDVGWLVTALSLVSVAILLKERKKGPKMVLFVLLWIAITYLVLSVSFGKPSWMVHTTLPAFALLAGYGMSRIFEAIARRKLAISALISVLVVALVFSTLTGYSTFVTEALPENCYDSWLQYKEMAGFINERHGDRVMIGYHQVTPIFLFYLNCYYPDRLAYMDEALPPGVTSRDTVFMIDEMTSLDLYEQRVEAVMPDYVVTARHYVSTRIAEGLSRLAEPIRVYDYGMIFGGLELVEAIRED